MNKSEYGFGMEKNNRNKINRILKRPDFILASRGRKEYSVGMNIQARDRRNKDDLESNIIRVGITCSRKVGNAVTRNRAKRRLRELSRKVVLNYGRSGWDYVLIGRNSETCKRPFELLIKDLEDILRKLHQKAVH